MEGWVGKGCSIFGGHARHGRRRKWRKTALAFSLTLAASLPFDTAEAVVQIVINPSGMLQDGMNFSSTLAHYAEVVKKYGMDVAHYKAVIEHYAQQVIQLQGLASINLSTTRMAPTLSELTESQRAEKISRSCPSADGKPLLGKLVDMLTPKLTVPISERQQNLCEQIAGIRIDKFNKTIKMVNRLREFQDNADALAETLKKLGSRQGDLDGFKGVVAANQATLEVEVQNWQANIQADDQIVSYLEEDQRVLGRTAMRGDRSVAGKIVHAATLAAALRAL